MLVCCSACRFSLFVLGGGRANLLHWHVIHLLAKELHNVVGKRTKWCSRFADCIRWQIVRTRWSFPGHGFQRPGPPAPFLMVGFLFCWGNWVSVSWSDLTMWRGIVAYANIDSVRMVRTRHSSDRFVTSAWKRGPPLGSMLNAQMLSTMPAQMTFRRVYFLDGQCACPSVQGVL